MLNLKNFKLILCRLFAADIIAAVFFMIKAKKNYILIRSISAARSEYVYLQTDTKRILLMVYKMSEIVQFAVINNFEIKTVIALCFLTLQTYFIKYNNLSIFTLLVFFAQQKKIYLIEPQTYIFTPKCCSCIKCNQRQTWLKIRNIVFMHISVSTRNMRAYDRSNYIEPITVRKYTYIPHRNVLMQHSSMNVSFAIRFWFLYMKIEELCMFEAFGSIFMQYRTRSTFFALPL